MATQFTPYVQSYDPYLSSRSKNTIPTHQNVSEIGGEITSVKTMLGEVLAKLSKLDTIESMIMGALSTSVEEIKTESARAKEEVDAMKKVLKEVKEKNNALEKRVIDLQSRTMKDNLVFFNINEDEKVKDDERIDTDAVLQKFIKDSINVKTEIMFERAHRIGKVRRAPDGSIIA